eukprot:scaffold4548_cov107-Isochrysis_galbana.AAC.7
MVSNKGAGSVGGEKGAHRLGVHRPIVHIAIAVVGDVEDHELGLGRRLFAQLGKLAHLRHGPFAFFGGDEEEHRLSASRLCRLGERRLRLEQRRLLLWRASLSHHAEAALFVAAHVDHTGGGCHGKLAPSGSAETAERPDALITSPVAPSISTRRLVARVAVRDREPRHLAEVLAERRGGAVGGAKDDLELLAVGANLVVRLDQQRCERLARRAPVRGEVQTDNLAGALNIVDRNVILLGEKVLAECLPQGWRLPRERRARWVLHDCGAAVARDELARLAVNDDQRRNALHLVLFGEGSLQVAGLEWEREPRLLRIVLVEGCLVLVGGDEDHLERLTQLTRQLLVLCCKLWSEAAARPTPVGREVEGHRVLIACNVGRLHLQGGAGSQDSKCDSLRSKTVRCTRGIGRLLCTVSASRGI